MRACIFASTVFALVGFVASQQPSQVPPIAGKVIDNQYVRVFFQPPQLRSVPMMHEFDALCISVFDATPKAKHDRKITEQPLPYVQADYFPQEEQQIMPISMDRDPIKSIWIELKMPPPQASFGLDAVKLDPDHNLVLFENDRVRVVRVHFGLGERGPVVDKRPRVIILLNDMHADVARHEGDTPSPRDGKAGAIQWSLGGSQATMNRNETKLDNIVVEIKGKV